MKGLKLNYFKMSKYNTEIDILYGKKKIQKIFFLIFFSDFFYQTSITFFGAIRRRSEENKKDAPKSQLFKTVLRFFRTF
jgi:hypothetical protein